jgi:DUF218 domain
VFDLIAILGRGIQRQYEGGPWVLTEDLEVCNANSAHLPVRVEADDTNPFCMVGGGLMNLHAGQILVAKYRPKLVVCAHGDRSGYLKSVDGPSESEVMCDRIIAPNSSIVVWPSERSHPAPSNTRQELLNVFELAYERDFKNVMIVTVGVHVPRTATYIAKFLSGGGYSDLSVRVFESEEVLLTANPTDFGPRVDALRASKAFGRTWEREANGISKIVRDAYNDAVKPPVQ